MNDYNYHILNWLPVVLIILIPINIAASYIAYRLRANFEKKQTQKQITAIWLIPFIGIIFLIPAIITSNKRIMEPYKDETERNREIDKSAPWP